MSRLDDTIILKDFMSDKDIDALVDIYNKNLDQAKSKSTGPTTVITRHFKEDPEFIRIFERISAELGMDLGIDLGI